MTKRNHPYKSFAGKAFWSRAVAGIPSDEIDPVGIFDLCLTPEMRVATAGSCFAQHIARHLQASGFHYYVAEPGHPLISEKVRKQNNYGIFSARYGNIYTARQLLQLIRRAYGRFVPQEDAWVEGNGIVRDPFRPTSQPGGYISLQEMHIDRQQHFTAVREMFENLDVFVFTLGLTECWRCSADGAVLPLCPGVEGGTFDETLYEFYNQSANDVIADLSEFFDELRAVNAKAQIILTVSPVPLAATASTGGHVLSATTYSKSVLRVAAEVVTKRFAEIHYFPSYEIITGAFPRCVLWRESA